jgi:adenylosuccinate lyase
MFFATLGVIASSIERLATEVRHLQRTEVLEAEEYFSPGQKGSSAMPHKRNPVLSENLTGLTRLVRGMTVHADRMRANLELTSGALFSQRVLLALVASGMQRDDAYRIVQRLAQQAWDTQTPLRRLLEQEDVSLDLDEVFDYGYYVRFVPQALERLEVIASPS